MYLRRAVNIRQPRTLPNTADRPAGSLPAPSATIRHLTSTHSKTLSQQSL